MKTYSVYMNGKPIATGLEYNNSLFCLGLY